MPFLNLPDEELCHLLKEGDEKALQEIMHRYWEPLYKMAANTLNDFPLCEDIVQELFIELWNRRETLSFTYSIKAYLFAGVRYEVYRQVKRQMRFDSQRDVEELKYIERYNPQNILEFDELMRNVEKIVAHLPDRCKMIYRLSREQQLPHKEIAARLDISTKTVENQLTIALRRIRSGIGKIFFLFF